MFDDSSLSRQPPCSATESLELFVSHFCTAVVLPPPPMGAANLQCLGAMPVWFDKVEDAATAW
jgi:hypothetical protein